MVEQQWDGSLPLRWQRLDGGGWDGRAFSDCRPLVILSLCGRGNDVKRGPTDPDAKRD